MVIARSALDRDRRILARAAPDIQKLNIDTPASVMYDWLLSTMHGAGGARLALILFAVVIALLVLEGGALLPRAPFAVALCSLLLVSLVAETGYAFKRLFAVNGTSAAADPGWSPARVGRRSDQRRQRRVVRPVSASAGGLLGECRFIVGHRVLEPLGAARDRATQ